MIRFHIRGDVQWETKNVRKTILEFPKKWNVELEPMYWYRIKIFGIPTPFIRLIP